MRNIGVFASYDVPGKEAQAMLGTIRRSPISNC
jgi:hypothetical protein